MWIIQCWQFIIIIWKVKVQWLLSSVWIRFHLFVNTKVKIGVTRVSSNSQVTLCWVSTVSVILRDRKHEESFLFPVSLLQIWALGRHSVGGSVSSISLPVQIGEESTGTVCQGHHGTKELKRQTESERERGKRDNYTSIMTSGSTAMVSNLHQLTNHRYIYIFMYSHL